MSNKKFEEFKATEVPLEGTNLIEASAGTGKTYSIAILVLRLVLEKKLPLKEILMVTFTKAAVAELEDRIRLFIRQAYIVAQGGRIKDETIAGLVRRAAQELGSDQIHQRLKEAVLFLDETSVLTIHSFCQQTLSNFAFETGQLFGMETMQDSSALMEDAVNNFWRKYVTVIPVDLLEQLCGAAFTRQSIIKVIKQFLDGKRYLPYSALDKYTLCNEDYQTFWNDVSRLMEAENELRRRMEAFVLEHLPRLQVAASGNTYTRKAGLHLINDPKKFIDAVYERRDKGYAQRLFQDILDQCADCDEAAERRNQYLQHVIDKILCLAIQEISVLVTEQKQAARQMSFDDMITDLHKALVGKDNPNLVAGLQVRYKAVFIDEFQDTDRLQYEIFERAFGTHTILFYIGDPKQSIYAFRKADIFTYFKAVDAAEHLYSMNVNFRSSAPFIAAMNAFFLPRPDFDTFHFGQSADTIRYLEVGAPEQDHKGVLMRGDTAAIPLTIFEQPNKDSITDATAKLVAELLGGGHYTIQKGDQQRNLTPADIGILVRSNKDGRKVKAALSKFGIPGITLGDSKVLDSDEALTVLYLLEAMHDISRGSINRALLGGFTGLEESDLLQLNEEVTTALFKKYKAAWENDGIYTALSDFMADFDVYGVLIGGKSENGERIMTNLLQLMEILHKMQTHKQLSPLELMGWLKRGIDGMATEGDEFEQRIESDEEAVKIVTIHKSKGLEYKVVITPFLDFLASLPEGICSFRDSQSGEYIAALPSQLTAQQEAEMLQQLEQENRRLIYVAITRAVYGCFIFKNTGNHGKYQFGRNSSLVPFMEECKRLNNAHIEFGEVPAQPEIALNWNSYDEEPKAPALVDFKLRDEHWMRLSYSRLNNKNSALRLGRAVPQVDRYSQFIFQELARGAKTGDLIHFIFEKINFQKPQSWAYTIEQAIRRFAPSQQERYTEMLNELITHVLEARIPVAGMNFSLAEVAPEKKLHEFEFDFPYAEVDTRIFEQLSGPDRRVYCDPLSASGGLVNGKIDLFFEHNNQFFILDWKSNYLGHQVDDYTAENLAENMNEHNYHLQYLIYTVAADKYLASRLPMYEYDKHFGGVIYAFVRGVRKHSTNGFFVVKPTQEEIQTINQTFGNLMDVQI